MPDSNPHNDAAGAEVCPVDHKSREAWLKQTQNGSTSQPHPHPSLPNITASSTSATSTTSLTWSSLLRSYIPYSSSSSSSATSQPPKQASPNSSLDTHRVVSSIPRTKSPGPSTCPADDDQRSNAPTLPPPSTESRPANSERDTGADPVTGNWVYPSEKMFFDAMKRKGHGVRGEDMRTVVPIHNAVNERAWKEIKEWEMPYTEGTTCAGPRLHSFTGLSDRMSPKARINTLLGYTAPFDRHDWVVDRCGVQVDYVIDFYAGRNTQSGGGGGGAALGPSFYLDVRPKLNSWEGVKMRVLRGVGFV